MKTNKGSEVARPGVVYDFVKKGAKEVEQKHSLVWTTPMNSNRVTGHFLKIRSIF
jgi:hypothetical protein